MITGVINAKEERDVLIADVPNAFIQAPMPQVKPNEDRVMIQFPRRMDENWLRNVLVN